MCYPARQFQPPTGGGPPAHNDMKRRKQGKNQHCQVGSRQGPAPLAGSKSGVNTKIYEGCPANYPAACLTQRVGSRGWAAGRGGHVMKGEDSKEAWLQWPCAAVEAGQLLGKKENCGAASGGGTRGAKNGACQLSTGRGWSAGGRAKGGVPCHPRLTCWPCRPPARRSWAACSPLSSHSPGSR